MPDVETGAPAPAEEDPKIVAMTEQLAAMLGGMDLGEEGAKALIVVAYTLLILGDATEDSVAEYCKRVWDGITTHINMRREIAAFINLETPTDSIH